MDRITAKRKDDVIHIYNGTSYIGGIVGNVDVKDNGQSFIIANNDIMLFVDNYEVIQ